MTEPTYDELRARHSSDGGSVSSIQKTHQDDLAPSLIWRQMRDLQMAIDDTEQIIADLYIKFAPVLCEDTTTTDPESGEIRSKSVNSEYLEFLIGLEKTVFSQHKNLRTLMERCEL